MITPSGCTETKRPIRNGWSTCASSCCTPTTTPNMISAVTGPDRDECDEDGDGAGDERTDQRHEGAEEDQHTDRADERHAEDRGTDHDADRVGAGDEHRGPHELGQRPPGHPTRRVGPEPAGAREQAHHPGPDEVAVGEEEVRREQHDEDAGDDVPDRRTDLADLADRVVAVARDLLLGLVERLAELLVGEVQRTVAQPVADLVDAVGDLLGEVADARGTTWLLTKVTSSAISPMPKMTTSSAASLRGMPSRCPHTTTGLTSAAISSAITTGSTTTRKKLSSHRMIAPGRADDEEAPGPRRGQVHAVGHLGGLEVRGPAGDLRLDLRRTAGGPHLGPLLGDPGAQVLLGGLRARTASARGSR